MNYHNVEIECTSLFIKIFNLNWEVVKLDTILRPYDPRTLKIKTVQMEQMHKQTPSCMAVLIIVHRHIHCEEKFPQVQLARCIPIHSPLRNATSGTGENVYFFIFPQWLKLHSNLLPMWTNHWSIILLQKQVKKVRVPYNSWGVYGQIDDQPCLIKARGLLFRVESMQCADS